MMIKQSLSRSKPYKAAAPEKTIARIQKILNAVGLSFVEVPVIEQGPFFSTCLRLLHPENQQIIFETMGKGLTNAYALASAYGEMIERLQNMAFFMMLKYPSEPELDADLPYPFKYYPDEQMMPWLDLSPHAANLFKNRLSDFPPTMFQEQALRAVPFWNVFLQRTEWLPFRNLILIVGSNGMCSGNTRDEALIHGLCEVFERHVLKQMFLSPFCPPTVPMDLFSGHEIIETMQRLSRDAGYIIRIKDCSLGKRFPVLGLLIMNQHGQYAFHLGSDPSPVTALERCFTEMFQGGPPTFNDMSEIPPFPYDIASSSFWKKQLHQNIRSYQGHWPSLLFEDTPDYAFESIAHSTSSSDADDLHYLLELMQAEGLEFLLRDHSFLGFPSYYIYIPGMSEMSNVTGNSFVKACLLFDQHMPTLLNLPAADDLQKLSLAEAVKAYAAVAPSGQFHAGDYFHHYSQHPVAGLSQEKLMTLFHDDLREATLSIPPCFDCDLCQQVAQCSFRHINNITRSMKASMSASAILQIGLL